MAEEQNRRHNKDPVPDKSNVDKAGDAGKLDKSIFPCQITKLIPLV